MSQSELIKVVKKNGIGKEYESRYTSSVCMHFSTRDRLQRYGQSGISLRKILLRMLDVLDMYPEIKKLVTEYDYKEMKL